MPTRTTIDRFLASERVALIGMSRDPKKFPNMVFRELRAHGYDVIPVHAEVKEIEGVDCARCVADLPEVDGAIIIVRPERAAGLVSECADRGIDRVWLHKGLGAGSNTEAAVEVAKARGVDVVDGACPLMFLDGTGFVHRLHRLVAGKKILAAA